MKNKKEALNNEKLQKICKEIEDDLKENGRILVRASGTEPKIRIMIECNDEEKMNQLDLELNKLYDDILANEFMVAFAEASDEVDRLTKHIQAIITATVNGGDPMTVELPAGGCSGSCSSCSGCH